MDPSRPSPPPPPKDPQMAVPNTFKYQRLPGRRDIRLIKLPSTPEETFDLITTSVDNAPEYSALSYTWGSPLRGVREDEYQGTPIPRAVTTPAGRRCIFISRNLHEAICAIIKTKSACYLWADGICIDQTNSKEKLVQIPLMGEIYSRCNKTIVWLGEDMENVDDMVHIHHRTLGPELARRRWSDITSYFISHTNTHLDPLSIEDFVSKFLGVQVDEKQWKSYVAFYDRRRWFSRLWVVQEIALAPTIQVLCGTISLDWDSMHLVALALLQSPSITTQLQFLRTIKTQRSVGSEVVTPGSFRIRCMSGGAMAGDHPILGKFRAYTPGAHTDRELQYTFLDYALRIVWGFHVTFPQDKVYGMLGVFSKFWPGGLDPLLLSKDAASLSVQQVYTNVTWLILKELPCLSALSAVDGPSTTRMPGLPSWVPDYNVHRADNTLSALLNDRIDVNASLADRMKPAYRSLAGTELTLEGISFDIVSHAADSWDASEGDGERNCLHLALKVLDDHLWFCHTGTTAQVGKQTYDLLYQTVMLGPDPSNPGTQLHDFIISTLAFAKLKGESLHPSYTRCLESLRVFKQAGIPGFPTVEEVETTISAVADDVHRHLREFRCRESRYYDFSGRAAWIGLNRRLFRTKRGHLGLGPRSLQPGDQVWLINGAKYLFVLRETGEVGKYTLVGEAYMHGFMNGEIFDSDVGDGMQRFVLV